MKKIIEAQLTKEGADTHVIMDVKGNVICRFESESHAKKFGQAFISAYRTFEELRRFKSKVNLHNKQLKELNKEIDAHNYKLATKAQQIKTLAPVLISKENDVLARLALGGN